MSIETKHSPELRAWFRAHGQPENSPVWYPTPEEISLALKLEAERQAKKP